MIAHIRNKIFLLAFFFLISNASAQNAVIKSIEINGNKFFDKSDYLKWIGININQRTFPGITDTIQNRITSNLIQNGYHLFKLYKVQTDSIDSVSVRLLIELSEDNPTEISDIQFVDIDSSDIAFLQSSLSF